MRWQTFVAVGDSFTEGLDDAYPNGDGYRGWADLVAARLAAEHRAAQQRAAARLAAEQPAAATGSPGPDFRYANLAVRGRLFHSIVDDQVPTALRMRPDLVSFAGGGNDVLRRHFEPPAMVTRFDDVVRMLRAGGADVLLFRFADLTARLPGGRMIRPRVEILNRAVGEVAEKHQATLVDLWTDDEFGNPVLWSLDRLHLSAAGHQRVAAHVLAALGLVADPQWWAPPPPPPDRSWGAARRADLRWAGQHLAPWLQRRLAGRSSGDARSAKRPSLGPVDTG